MPAVHDVVTAGAVGTFAVDRLADDSIYGLMTTTIVLFLQRVSRLWDSQATKYDPSAPDLKKNPQIRCINYRKLVDRVSPCGM